MNYRSYGNNDIRKRMIEYLGGASLKDATGHANLSGDLETVVYKLSGHLKMLHAADNNRQSDDHLPPGKGNINWARLILDLLDTAFQGTFIMELSNDQGKTGKEFLKEAVQARQYLRDITRKIKLDRSAKNP